MIKGNVCKRFSVKRGKRQEKFGNMSSRSISTFERLLRESHGRLECQAAVVRSVLRDSKNTESEKKNLDELLKDLKQVGKHFYFMFSTEI